VLHFDKDKILFILLRLVLEFYVHVKSEKLKIKVVLFCVGLKLLVWYLNSRGTEIYR